MEENFDQTELHQIINRALAKCMNYENQTVNTEMNIFCTRYCSRQNKNAQDTSQVHLPYELSKALCFCNNLEEYRRVNDIYSDKDDTMSEQQYRQLLSMLSDYDEYISPKNKDTQRILEKSIKRCLPEYKDEILLDDYNEKADRVYELKKEYEKARRKKQPAAKNYEIEALRFFEEVFADKNLHNIETHPKKVTLYEKCINIVNCLPSERYGRTAKFKLKGSLNHGLLRAASLLGEEYLPIAIKAKKEMQQYQTAIEKAKHYANGSPSKRKLSIEEYNRQKFEEWYYR